MTTPPTLRRWVLGAHSSFSVQCGTTRLMPAVPPKPQLCLRAKEVAVKTARLNSGLEAIPVITAHKIVMTEIAAPSRLSCRPTAASSLGSPHLQRGYPEGFGPGRVLTASSRARTPTMSPRAAARPSTSRSAPLLSTAGPQRRGASLTAALNPLRSSAPPRARRGLRHLGGTSEVGEGRVRGSTFPSTGILLLAAGGCLPSFLPRLGQAERGPLLPHAGGGIGGGLPRQREAAERERLPCCPWGTGLLCSSPTDSWIRGLPFLPAAGGCGQPG